MYLRSTRRILSILLIAVLFITGMVPTAFASVSAKINTSSAKVYRSASTKSQSVKVPKNLKVSITAVNGSWARVSYKGISAYMPMKHLSPTQKTKGYVTKSASVYNSAGKKICSVSKGASLYVLGTVNGGYCVMNSSGTVGYMKSGTLSSKKPSSGTSKKTTAVTGVNKVLSVARSLVGRQYSLNDNPPQSFNCSSFVWYCMGKAGYSMKGTAAQQAADDRYRKISSVSSLKKGDVLCFDTTGDGCVDHSAIYIGSGKFVEASHNAGKVQVNSLTSWYKSHFKCARRPA